MADTGNYFKVLRVGVLPCGVHEPVLEFDDVAYLRSRIASVADHLGFPGSVLEDFLTPTLGSSARDCEARIRIVDEVLSLVSATIDREDLPGWWHRPTPFLHGAAPLALALESMGGLRCVRTHLRQLNGFLFPPDGSSEG